MKDTKHGGNTSEKDSTKEPINICLSQNQIYIIQGFLYDYNTTAARRVAEYLQKKIDEVHKPNST